MTTSLSQYLFENLHSRPLPCMLHKTLFFRLRDHISSLDPVSQSLQRQRLLSYLGCLLFLLEGDVHNENEFPVVSFAPAPPPLYCRRIEVPRPQKPTLSECLQQVQTHPLFLGPEPPKDQCHEDDETKSEYWEMPSKFHKPPPLSQIFTPKRLSQISNCLGRPTTEPRDGSEFTGIVEDLREKLNAGPALKYEVQRKRSHKRKHKLADKNRDRKDSFQAVYNPAKMEKQNSQYSKDLRLLAVLEGRLRQYVLGGGVRAECALLDKSGLTTSFVTDPAQLDQDLPTSIFVTMASAEFSTRKAFTLNKQQQGALDPVLQHMLSDLEFHPRETRWDLVALVYPTSKVIAAMTLDQRRRHIEGWRKQLDVLGRFLHQQWDLGVNKCAFRSMKVPRKGTTQVDSDGWNRVCGAWNNAARCLRGLEGSEFNGLFKCLKLTAADQMCWADSSGQGADPDTLVFSDISEQGYLPWSMLSLRPEDSEELISKVRGAIEAACAKHGVETYKWLGKPQERQQEEVKEHRTMICGVGVPEFLTTDQITALKKLGVYGSKP